MTKTYDEIKKDADAIKEKICQLAKKLIDFSAERQVPAASLKLDEIEAALADQNHYVAVCGEVKKGKSSLINAIIGKELLPVDCNVATSQVFCISNAKEESFALVFEDGHREPIDRNGLIRYGTQTAANLLGEPLFQGRTLRWIEVNTPVAFLPEGIHLIDTPGLGATYATHSAVTRRILEEVDAVIFLLDSQHPVTTEDKALLEKIYSITPDVLYVQSKIDISGSNWEKMHEDHVRNLNEQFGHLGVQIQVFPISSKMLESSLSIDGNVDEFDYTESRFEVFRQALLKLLYKVTCWNTAANTVQALNIQFVQVEKWLKERKVNLHQEGEEAKRKVAQDIEALKKQFQADWIQPGEKKTKAVQVVQSEMERFKNSVRVICMPNGTIEERYSRLIMDTADQQQLQQLNDSLVQELQTAVQMEWTRLLEESQRKIFSQLKLQNLSFEVDLPMLDLPVKPLKTRTTYETITKIGQSSLQGGAGGAVVGTVGLGILAGVGAILTGGAILPLVIAGAGLGSQLGGLGGAAVGAFKGLQQAGDVTQIQDQVLQNMRSLLSAMNNYLYYGDNTGRSPVSEYVEQVRNEFHVQQNSEIRQQQMYLDERTQNLQAELQFTGKELQAARECVEQDMKMLSSSRPELLTIAEGLKALKAEI
ncbi:MAG: hypothetical protein E7029_04800 [Planctomycetaceae bacterium]|nr:hypothetical protein [Planctomycetaceae bacterium]